MTDRVEAEFTGKILLDPSTFQTQLSKTMEIPSVSKSFVEIKEQDQMEMYGCIPIYVSDRSTFGWATMGRAGTSMFTALHATQDIKDADKLEKRFGKCLTVPLQDGQEEIDRCDLHVFTTGDADNVRDALGDGVDWDYEPSTGDILYPTGYPAGVRYGPPQNSPFTIVFENRNKANTFWIQDDGLEEFPPHLIGGMSGGPVYAKKPGGTIIQKPVGWIIATASLYNEARAEHNPWGVVKFFSDLPA